MTTDFQGLKNGTFCHMQIIAVGRLIAFIYLIDNSSTSPTSWASRWGGNWTPTDGVGSWYLMCH